MQLLLGWWRCCCFCCFFPRTLEFLNFSFFFVEWKQKPNVDHMWLTQCIELCNVILSLSLSLSFSRAASKTFNILIIFSCILAQLKLPREHYMKFPFMFPFRLENEQMQIGKTRALYILSSMPCVFHSIFCCYFISFF